MYILYIFHLCERVWSLCFLVVPLFHSYRKCVLSFTCMRVLNVLQGRPDKKGDSQWTELWTTDLWNEIYSSCATLCYLCVSEKMMIPTRLRNSYIDRKELNCSFYAFWPALGNNTYIGKYCWSAYIAGPLPSNFNVLLLLLLLLLDHVWQTAHTRKIQHT